MINVAVISTVSIRYDGITNVILSHLKSIDRNKYRIIVIGQLDSEKEIINRIEAAGIQVYLLVNRKRNALKYFFQLVKVLKNERIEIVHAHGNSATLFIEMMAGVFACCRKRIAHSHNTKCDYVKIDNILRPFFYLSYTHAVACGKEAGLWLFRDKKFEIIPNGRDCATFAFNDSRRLKIRDFYGIDEQIVIGHVGSFVEQKNYGYLIRIFKELFENDSNVRGLIIGDGPMKSDIQEKCKIFGDKLLFTGNINNISEVLNAVDGMLLPSFFEGLPLVAIEWQINGIPCILSDAVTKETKFSDICCYKSIEDDPREWAIQILKMVKENNREKSSQRGVLLAKEKGFDTENIGKIIDRLYE